MKPRGLLDIAHLSFWCAALCPTVAATLVAFAEVGTAHRDAAPRHFLSSFLVARRRWRTHGRSATSGRAEARDAVDSSWRDVERQLGAAFLHPAPAVVDSALDPLTPPFLSEPTRPVLFRERHGWCPYSERVWLALELFNIDHDTVLIDNTGHGPRPSYFAGQTPQIQWPSQEGGEPCRRRQGESMDLVAELDERYQCGLQARRPDVQAAVAQLPRIFPKARPSSRAAYLFRPNGEPLGVFAFREALRKMEDLLSEGDGPFLCGANFTAADLAYLLFLERYRYQLPCLHGANNLRPDDPSQYPRLAAWYRAADQLPAYASRVKGDAASWAKVFAMAGYGNDGFPPATQTNADEILRDEEGFSTFVELPLWRTYASTRPSLAKTPHGQAALVIAKNRHAIAADAAQRLPGSPETESIDRQLRELAQHLLLQAALAEEGKTSDRLASAEDVRSLAEFLDHRMCVPRDMGAMPAACIRRIAASGGGS